MTSSRHLALVPSDSVQIAETGWTVEDFAEASRSEGTRRAYSASLRAFATWCNEQGCSSLPAAPEMVARYFTSMAIAGKKLATIHRAKAATDVAHKLSGYNPPCRDVRVRAVLSGIARRMGGTPEQKEPLVTDDLRRLLQHVGPGLTGLRDRAILLLGFASAMRRSELVALTVADVEFTAEGLLVKVRRSKTDQQGRGTVVGVPHGASPETCPVRALKAWLEAAGIEAGPVFRGVSRHGHVAKKALTPSVIARVVKAYVEAAGLDPDLFGAHSLRAGFITAAAMSGVEERDIQRQSRHKSVTVLRGYVRQASVINHNAAAKVGL